jgi:hypothetical protein
MKSTPADLNARSIAATIALLAVVCPRSNRMIVVALQPLAAADKSPTAQPSAARAARHCIGSII